jgi:hypothetical protein
VQDFPLGLPSIFSFGLLFRTGDSNDPPAQDAIASANRRLGVSEGMENPLRTDRSRLGNPAKPSRADIIRWFFLRPKGHLAARRGLSDIVVSLPLGLSNPVSTEIDISVVLHAYYLDQIDDFVNYFKNIARPFKLYISTDTRDKADFLTENFSAAFPEIFLRVRVFPNRGRDIAPKFIGYREAHDNADLVLHLEVFADAMLPRFARNRR